MSHRLQFHRPATEWTDALPLGNGRLAAMCFGGTRRDRLQLNEGSLWSGAPIDPADAVDADTARSVLERSRRALDAGDAPAAETALRELQYGHPQSYQPLIDLHRGLGPDRGRDGAVGEPAQGYLRSLDLWRAVSSTRFTLDGVAVEQDAFISAGHGVLVLDLRVDEPTVITIEISSPLPIQQRQADGSSMLAVVAAPRDVAPAWERRQTPISWDETPDTATRAAVQAELITDVAVHSDSGGETIILRTEPTRRATLMLAAETTVDTVGQRPSRPLQSVITAARERVDRAVRDGVDAVLARHVADHGELYDRCTLSFDRCADPTAGDTGDRLESIQRTGWADPWADPELVATVFHYGRYLLISSSRAGGVAANLQGIWNELLQPPWSGNYTMNINLEMNYWPAEVTDLRECLPPLFELITALAEHGEETASRLYGAPGWVAHHCSDVWAYTEPVGDGTHDPAWAFWPMAGPWLINHLWDHLRFGADDGFARRSWPVIAGCAEFVLHWLRSRPDGTLGTVPSTSPENRYLTPSGDDTSVGVSSTMDLVLAAQLLRIVDRLADRLEIDEPVVTAARAALGRIPAPEIGADGLVAEWAGNPPMADPQHRHMAHLCFVHPLDAEPAPALAEAASRSLDARGDDSTGWSLAWKTAMRARLGEPEPIARLLRLFFRTASADRGRWSGGLYRNLFSAHPPFQFDGNLGFVAGWSECLLQSHRNRIDLLPALPPGTPDGSITGLIARPGIAVDLSWRDGRLGSVRLRCRDAAATGRYRIGYAGRFTSVDIHADRAVVLYPNDLTASDVDHRSGASVPAGDLEGVPQP